MSFIIIEIFFFFKNLLRDLEFKPFLHQNLIGAFDLMIKINNHEGQHKLNFYVIYPKKKRNEYMAYAFYNN